MKPQAYFSHSDLQTRNLVLQVMEYDNGDLDVGSRRREYLASSLERLADNQEVVRKTDTSDVGAKLKKLLEKKGKAFLHTPEYYAAIEDEHERMKAYRLLVVSSAVPSGEDAEIVKNPFKYLGLPEDATFGQTRAAWIRLSKMWYPDMMVPENSEQYQRIFGIERFVIEGTNYNSWLEKILKSTPPEVLNVTEVEKLSPKGQDEYRQKHETYRAKEGEYEKVKAEMRLRATQKMQIINKAYAEARKRFSDAEEETFAGFEWISGKRDSPLAAVYPNFTGFLYNALNLEGPGQVRRDTGRYALDSFPYLAFDFGEIYLEDTDYRQSVRLKSFFAWTELVRGQELSPNLLDDIVSKYKLSHDKSEQLRLMIMNREEPEFVADALQIPRVKSEHYQLLHFIEEVYEGPMFYHSIIGRYERSFPLGIEFTPDGGMVLIYQSQEDQMMHWFATEETARFTPIDVQMMMAIAYGPMLQGKKD